MTVTHRGLREIAALLLTDAKLRRTTAARIRTEQGQFSQEVREQLAQDIETEAQQMEKAAKELQEFSFTWKG